MVRVNNYLFGANVRLPIKELFVCQSIYGLEYVREYVTLPIATPLIFQDHNPGWARAVSEWSKLTPATRALYDVLVFDDTSSSFYLWILDNLKNALAYDQYQAPAFVFPLHTEYEIDEGVGRVKIFIQDILPEIPDFNDFNHTLILKKAGADPDYSRECLLDTIPFNVDIIKIGGLYKIRQDLLLDFNIVPGVSYHYQICHYNYTINQSEYSNISIETIPA